jgi:hypothetical protein
MTAEGNTDAPRPVAAAGPDGGAGTVVSTMRAICPFLLAADGSWRSADASGDHRCTAVYPPIRLATDKQRRLCLTSLHSDCATFVAALAAREPSLATSPGSRPVRPIPDMTPVVLEQGRFSIPAMTFRADRRAGQAFLVVLLIVAFIGIALARLGSEKPGPAGGVAGATSTPTGASALPSDEADPGLVEPTASPVTEPTPTITLVPTEGSPPPTEQPATYKVKPGDTLSGIAAAHGTTWKVLAKLNHIKDPAKLRVGTVLQLP